MPKFGTKNTLFRYFWVRILKNYCHIWNQHLRICLTAKFCEETKMSKFGTKNAISGYFLTKNDLFGDFLVGILKVLWLKKLIKKLFVYKEFSNKNINYLNKHLFMFRKKDTKHCNFCKLQDETINHLFVECNYSKNLWRDLKTYCQPSFSLPLLCPQSATFGFFDIDPNSSYF